MSGDNDIDVIRFRGKKQASIEDLLGFEPVDEDQPLLSGQTTATGGLVLGAGGNLKIGDFNDLLTKMKNEGLMDAS